MPRHIAIIMDGNGRWARKLYLPRVAGHKRGVEALRNVVVACAKRNIACLTVFAFSSENWQRPREEVSFLMALFCSSLQDELKELNANKVRLQIIGDRSFFNSSMRRLIEDCETRTAQNTKLLLTIAINYGGRWDLLHAINRMTKERPELIGQYQESDLVPYLALANAPEPDLFIRTGGEQRISNFLLWQLAYTEFYFTDLLWPDFDEVTLDKAIDAYRQRERRFGRTSEQIFAAAASADSALVLSTSGSSN